MRLLLIVLAMSVMNSALAMKPTTSEKMVKFEVKDGDRTTAVEESFDVVTLSETIKNMLEDLAGGGVSDVAIPITNIESPIFTKIIEILKIYHDSPRNSPEEKEELIKKIANLINPLGMETLVQIANGADILDIPEDIQAVFGARILSEIDDYKAYIADSQKEKLISGVFNKYINSTLMQPLINQLKIEILKNTAQDRCKLLCEVSDSPESTFLVGRLSDWRFINKSQWVVISGMRHPEHNYAVGIWDIEKDISQNPIIKLELDKDNAPKAARSLAIHEGNRKNYIAIENCVPDGLHIVKVLDFDPFTVKTCNYTDNPEAYCIAFNAAGTILTTRVRSLAPRKKDVVFWNVDAIDWEQEKPILDKNNMCILPADDAVDFWNLMVEENKCYVLGYAKKRKCLQLSTCNLSFGENSSCTSQEDIIIIDNIRYYGNAAFSPSGKKIAALVMGGNWPKARPKIIIYNRNLGKIERSIELPFLDMVPYMESLKISFIDEDILVISGPAEYPPERILDIVAGGITLIHNRCFVVDSLTGKIQQFLNGFTDIDNVRFNAAGTKMIFWGNLKKIGVFSCNMFNDDEKKVFEVMKKADLEQDALFNKIISSADKSVFFDDEEKGIWNRDSAIFNTTVRNVLKKHYPDGTKTLPILSYEEKYLRPLGEMPDKSRLKSLKKAEQSLSLLQKKSAQQKQIQQELQSVRVAPIQPAPIQQKTWWKERLKNLASGIQDAFSAAKNAAYRYWQSSGQ